MKMFTGSFDRKIKMWNVSMLGPKNFRSKKGTYNRYFNNFEDGFSLDNRLISFESFNFIFLMLGLGAVYLNKDTPQLTYYKTAVYPVYIVHLPVQMAVMYFFAGINIHPIIKFPIALFLICFLSLTIYHAVKNVKLLRPLFGLRNK